MTRQMWELLAHWPVLPGIQEVLRPCFRTSRP